MADLTVTLTESVTLQGESRGSTNTLTIGSVESTLERIVTCPASNPTTIATFNSNVYGAAGAIDIEDTKYKNFCIQEWAEYAMNYNKLDKLSFRIWVAKNDKELKEKWKTTK